MDIKVSLDKAKKLRPRRGATALAASKSPASEEQASDWQAPAYGECRSVELDSAGLRRNRCVCFFPEAPELGYYKLLRTQIVQRCKPNNWNTIMITSAVPGEGKTLTAINLAATFAKAFGQTALLVDCDFQRQSVHRYLGVSSPAGLADHLRNGTPLNDIIMWPGVEKLTVISGGQPVRDSAELISSPRMAELVEEMKGRYSDRYIFFDLPPLLAEADALAFAPLADCFLMVVHPGTSFGDIQRALALVPMEKFLGFALNRVEASSDGYYYRYKYGHRKGGKSEVGK
jgi:protein-tyrosine kinase